MADRKIDIHAHFIPEIYRKALLDNGITDPDGMPGIAAWSAESHLEYMNVSLFSNAFLFFPTLWLKYEDMTYHPRALVVSKGNPLKAVFVSFCLLSPKSKF